CARWSHWYFDVW
nr:immunoglobulin heavy chain junction region [Mus musculus]